MQHQRDLIILVEGPLAAVIFRCIFRDNAVCLFFAEKAKNKSSHRVYLTKEIYIT